ncbi:MAG TPA: serine hydrolase [Nevskiaceae bacterium]|nr:serine hydrolase [Nevskiaceae bacterium]
MSHAKTIHRARKQPSQLQHFRDVGLRLIDEKRVRGAAKAALEGVALAVLLTVSAQLLYPPSRTLPQTSIGGKSYAYQTKQHIAADIAALQNQKLHITSGSQTLSYAPKDMGINFAGTKDAEQATEYNWRERLVPFSIFFERRDIPNYGFTVDEPKARQFAATLKKYDKAPVDAAVRLEGAKVVVVKQQDGYSYDADHLVKAMKDIKLTSALHVTLQPKVVQPKITDDVAVAAANSMQQRLQKPLTVQAGGESVIADSATLASWAVLVPDAQNQKLHITYDKEKIKQWLAPFAQQVYTPGSPRTVTLLDGEVTGEANAADGQALDANATADAIIAAGIANQPTAAGKIQPVVRAAQTNRTYTRSSKGLQALLNYWDASNAGTWGIVLKDFSGNISASINPNRQFTSASVYKIYIAYVVYTKVDSGEFGMESSAGNGYTVAGCLDRMVVRSDNGCAHALGDMIGWEANNGMLHAKGFSSTSIVEGAQITSAQDTTSYLIQLQNGSLLSAGNREAMLYKMGHNIYRYAIPAGSTGMHSANKLGAQGTFNHDVAIVYHPKGTYVLSVFSQGSDHYRIRELARQVAAVMGQ